MRGPLQQGQDGPLHHAPRRREDLDPDGGPVQEHWLAAGQEVWLESRRLQNLNLKVRRYHLSHINKSLTQDSKQVWDEVEFANNVIKEELISYIGKRLTPQPTKVRADIEVTCFGYEGIDAVKTALRQAEARNTEDTQVKVKLVSPPLYVLTSQTLDKTIGITVLEEAIQEVTKTITAAGGTCSVKMAPKAVTENDDAELQALMDKRERENQEVSGDEDESEEDGIVAVDE